MATRVLPFFFDKIFSGQPPSFFLRATAEKWIYFLVEKIYGLETKVAIYYITKFSWKSISIFFSWVDMVIYDYCVVLVIFSRTIYIASFCYWAKRHSVKLY